MNGIRQYSICGTMVGVTDIAQGQPTTRRQRELDAVCALVDAMLGADVIITHNVDGSPRVEGVHISISHSRRVAVLAVSHSGPIGVDAEEWRDALLRTRTRYLSDAERLRLTSEEQLLRLWTIKEAVYKAAGIKNLALTSIDTDTDMLHAKAGNSTFDLHLISLPPTIITLALEHND